MTPTQVLDELIEKAKGHIHLWRFIAGIVFALEQYDRLSLTSPNVLQSDDFYCQEAHELLTKIRSTSDLPSNWHRGFFYNAAIMRLDAAWERSIRAMLGSSSGYKRGRDLYDRFRLTEPGLPVYDNSEFKRVRDEVNALKHDVGGVPATTREKPEVLREGLQELLTLLECRFVSATQE